MGICHPVGHNMSEFTAYQLYKAPYDFLFDKSLLYQQYAPLVKVDHSEISVTLGISVPSMYFVVFRFSAIHTCVPITTVRYMLPSMSVTDSELTELRLIINGPLSSLLKCSFNSSGVNMAV